MKDLYKPSIYKIGYTGSGLSVNEIKVIYNVSHSTISEITNHKRFKNV